MQHPTIYQYTNPETNRTEKVQKELWCWEAMYADGVTLKQFDDEGRFHRFAEIDQSKLYVFRMVADHTEQAYALLFDPHQMKLIHFYRNTVLEAGTPNETRVKTYCFGFEKHIAGKAHKHIIMLTETEVLVTDDPDRVQIV